VTIQAAYRLRQWSAVVHDKASERRRQLVDAARALFPMTASSAPRSGRLPPRRGCRWDVAAKERLLTAVLDVRVGVSAVFQRANIHAGLEFTLRHGLATTGSGWS